MSSSLQSLNAFEETFGANIKMPEQLNFKPLPQNFDALASTTPNIDFNEIYREDTIKSKYRKTRNSRQTKTYILKDSIMSEISSINIVNLI